MNRERTWGLPVVRGLLAGLVTVIALLVLSCIPDPDEGDGRTGSAAGGSPSGDPSPSGSSTAGGREASGETDGRRAEGSGGLAVLLEHDVYEVGETLVCEVVRSQPDGSFEPVPRPGRVEMDFRSLGSSHPQSPPMYDKETETWRKELVKAGIYRVQARTDRERARTVVEVRARPDSRHLTLAVTPEPPVTGEQVQIGVLLTENGKTIDLASDERYSQTAWASSARVWLTEPDGDRVIPLPAFAEGHWETTIKEPGTYYVFASAQGLEAGKRIEVTEADGGAAAGS